MNYYVLLLIQALDTEQFIEVGLDYYLPFHPNITDEIEVAGFPCEIKTIYYDLDRLTYITMRVEAIDNLICGDGCNSKKIHEWLMEEWRQLKEWSESNNAKIILNDYLNHPEKEINDE